MRTPKHNLKLLWLSSCLIGVLVFAFSSLSIAQVVASKTYDQFKNELETLKKTDPTIAKPETWDELSKRLYQSVKSNPKHQDAPRSLFLAARILEVIHDKRSFEGAAKTAAGYFEEVARSYPGHRLADDSLLHLGDLRRKALKDAVGAKAAYFEIVDSYAQGDQTAAARIRIDALEKQSKAEIAQEKKTTTSVSSASPKSTVRATPANGVSSSKSVTTTVTSMTVNKKSKKEDDVVREIISHKKSGLPPLVVIDPGHGGDNLGAIGVNQVLEKDVTLVISEMLEELLRERLGARTLLTRNSDISMDLAERTKIANDNNADLFVSIHTNASVKKNAQGVETYYLDNTNDKASLALAERENESFQRQMDDLAFMLSDLIQNAKLDESILLAHTIQDALVRTLQGYYKGVRDLGVKKAPFYVLVGAHMPCVLVEVSFIDHPVEGKRLISRNYQKLAAQAIHEGIRDYFVKSGVYDRTVSRVTK